MVHEWTLIPEEVEAGGSDNQGHPLLCGMFEASLGHVSHYLNNQTHLLPKQNPKPGELSPECWLFRLRHTHKHARLEKPETNITRLHCLPYLETENEFRRLLFP